ncbi:hypothetical protein HRbin01_00264 [archaeon HR01]|nr:hypothetical protein HRbin01_00264 [archaeon HR01]
MVEIIKAGVPNPVAKRFRKKAMDQYGYRKGAVKRAMQDLITRYISAGTADWKSLKGVIRSELSSIELQHRLWKRTD